MTGDMEERRLFCIHRQPDGSWTIAPQPPLPAVTAFISGGWADVTLYRDRWDAIDWFPNSDDYYQFCQEFGEPPINREDPDRTTE